MKEYWKTSSSDKNYSIKSDDTNSKVDYTSVHPNDKCKNGAPYMHIHNKDGSEWHMIDKKDRIDVIHTDANGNSQKDSWQKKW